MDFSTNVTGNEVVIKISGAIDTEAAEKLRAELNKVAKTNPKKVVMNLKLVPTIGSSGIGKILIFFKELDKNGASFEIKGIHDSLFNIFKSIKLDKLFPISKG